MNILHLLGKNFEKNPPKIGKNPHRFEKLSFLGIFFSFLNLFLSISDGYIKIFLEDIHDYVKCCEKILFLSVSHRSPLCAGPNKKNAQKWLLFKTMGGGDFRPIFSKKFFLWSKCNIFIPQKVWLLYLTYLVIFLILNNRHNQQKFLQTFLHFWKIWNFCWLWRSFKIENITKYERYSNQIFCRMNILHLLGKNFEKNPPKIGKNPHRFEKLSFLGIFFI